MRRTVILSNPTGPSLDLDMRSGTIPALISNNFTRASGATVHDATGTAVQVGANIPRLSYQMNSGGRTNWIRDSVGRGSTNGVVGSGGGFPTFWSLGGASGISFQVVGTGVESGIPYVDIRFFGTGTGSGFPTIFFESGSGVPACSGQQWTFSVYMSLQAGTWPGMGLKFSEVNSAGSQLAQHGSTSAAPTTGSLAAQRFSFTATNNQPGCAYVQPFVTTTTSLNQVVDYTMRFGCPQMEIGSYATDPIATSGSVVTAPVTNWLRNNTCATPVSGVPQFWVITVSNNGISTGTPTTSTDATTGMVYLDIPISGTATASANINVRPDTTNVVPGTSGQTWTLSAYAALILNSGTAPTVGSLVGEVAADGSTTLAQTTNTAALTTTFSRISATRTFNQAGTHYVMPVFQAALGSGLSTNCNLRIALAQLEQGSAPSTPVQTSGTVVTGPVLRGLLVEEQRTNVIRNPRFEGATVGGSTYPTNWIASSMNTNGMTTVVNAVGSENGIPFIDLAISGTPTGAFGMSVFFDSTSNPSAVAAQNQTWTGSMYLRVISGTFPSAGSLMYVKERASDGTNLGETDGPNLTPTTAPLATQRVSLSRTFTSASTAFSAFGFQIQFQASTAYNFVLRIGAPQLELGAFATTAILPTAGTPAASTRSADIATMPLGSWYSDVGGSAVVDFSVPQLPIVTANAVLMTVCDNSLNNRVMSFISGGQSDSVAVRFQRLGVNSNVANTGVPSIGSVNKHGAAWSHIGGMHTLNGAAPITVQGNYSPDRALLTSGLQLGNQPTGIGPSAALSGYIRRVRFWPRALSATELVTVTT